MIDALCTAVMAQLNAAVFSPTFTVTFDDSPEYGISTLDALTVTMLPYGVDIKERTRAEDNLTYTIEIAFQQHAAARPASGADPIIAMSASLRNLQQSVTSWLSVRTRRIPPTYPTARLTKIEQRTLYDSEYLRKGRIYVGVIRLTYEEIARPS